MSELVVAQKRDLINIADAIREKTGTTDGMGIDEMAALIGAIESGGGSGETTYETKTIGDFSLFELLKFGSFNGNDLWWFVADTDYEGHVIFTNLNFGVIPKMEFNNTTSNINLREDYHYATSSIRQFLNATGQDWYFQQIESCDNPSYVGLPGFLSGFSPEELSKIVPFECKCIEYSTSTDYIVKTITDNVWIPSRKQAGGNAGTAEGSRAFNSTSLSCVIGPMNVDCRSIFSITRTESNNYGILFSNDSSLSGNHARIKSQWPICISVDKQVNVKKLIADDSVPCWEVI